ncbi:MAG: quinone-dependent dihydroorotate dehydrogenase [Cyanobacteriota bacterium]|nr:quinone-dependent dihydroorotate dehydrogenase [Cyanobacteriota bacterium]
MNFDLIRPVLSSQLPADPEWLHRRTIDILALLNRKNQNPVARWLQSQWQDSLCLHDEQLSSSLWGLNFPNPVGLAAGFDKDGAAAGIWGTLGFGFAELGTVTLHAQPGNPRPRLFRLWRDRAALNRMGFNNCGAAQMVLNIKGISPHLRQLVPIGINLGKSKVTPLEESARDYLESFRLLKALGDYFVVNVSSPNTPGLRSLQAPKQLEPILSTLQTENHTTLPILVKISPDLAWEDMAAVVKLAREYELAGIIATNTTIRRDGLQTQVLPKTGKPIAEEAGGISGAPLRSRATQAIRFIWEQTQGEIPIVGVGGIFTAEDAWEKITAGASLVQVYTGWVYEGPAMVKHILTGLLEKLDENGLTHISQAVGMGNRE